MRRDQWFGHRIAGEWAPCRFGRRHSPRTLLFRRRLGIGALRCRLTLLRRGSSTGLLPSPTCVFLGLRFLSRTASLRAEAVFTAVQRSGDVALLTDAVQVRDHEVDDKGSRHREREHRQHPRQDAHDHFLLRIDLSASIAAPDLLLLNEARDEDDDDQGEVGECPQEVLPDHIEGGLGEIHP